MALFHSTPYIIYSDTRFTSNDFGLAWGDVDGDGIPELLVSPVIVNGSDQPVFLNYNGSGFHDKDIVVSDGGFPADTAPGFEIFDIDVDSKQEVLNYRDNGTLEIWKYSDAALRNTGIITGVANDPEAEISIARINGIVYLFSIADSGNQLVKIYSILNNIATPQPSFNTGMFTAGVAIKDIDCDGHFEMAVISNTVVKFFRLMNPSDITSWSDLNADLIIQNSNGFLESVVFANLDCPCRWDLVVTTSVGLAPADILVYKNAASCVQCVTPPAPPVTAPPAPTPSTLTMLLRLFGFLLGFILLGLLLRGRNTV